MASEVDICNLALANLGDSATVSSIYPPEGSMQAEHCARFYPIARNALLEMHQWSFSITREALVPLSYTVAPWDYVYAMPSSVINVISIIPPDVIDDYSIRSTYPSTYGWSPEVIPAAGFYSPQPYQIEIISGQQVVLSDLEDAQIRYTKKITDSTLFTPLFVTSLGWYLASMLAGPIIKGDAGAAEGKRCLQMFQANRVEATASDSQQRNIKPNQIVNWMAGR